MRRSRSITMGARAAAITAAAALLAAACTSPAQDDTASGDTNRSAVECPANPPTSDGKPKKIADGLLTVDESLALWKERPEDENRTGVTDDEIVLGSHEPLTGPLSAVASKPGFEALIKAVNDAGGIHGRKITIRYEDNGGNPAQAVTAAQKLLDQEQVFVMFGNQITAAFQATMDSIVAAKVPEIAPNTVLSEQNNPLQPTIVSYHLPGQTNGYHAGRTIAKDHPDAKVGVIYQNDQYGKETVAGLELALAEDGGTIVSRQPFSLGATNDFTSAVSAAVAKKPDVLMIEAQGPQAQTIMKALRGQLGSKLPVYFGTGQAHWYHYDDPNFDGAQGYVPVKPFKDPDDPMTKVAEKFFTKSGITYEGTVGGIAWLDIQQVQLLLHGLALAGPDPTREGLIAAYECGLTEQNALTCASCWAPYQVDADNHWANRTLHLTRWNQKNQQVEKVGEPVTVDINKILEASSK